MAPYEREYLHWMAVNIQGPDLKTDEIVVDYISPHPLVGTGNALTPPIYYKILLPRLKQLKLIKKYR